MHQTDHYDVAIESLFAVMSEHTLHFRDDEGPGSQLICETFLECRSIFTTEIRNMLLMIMRDRTGPQERPSHTPHPDFPGTTVRVILQVELLVVIAKAEMLYRSMQEHCLPREVRNHASVLTTIHLTQQEFAPLLLFSGFTLLIERFDLLFGHLLTGTFGLE